MSGIQQDRPGNRDVLAAEYVLGLLGPEDHREIARRLATDPALRDAVADWSARLAPLAELATPSPTSDLLWARLARDIEPQSPAPDNREQAALAPSARREAGGWRVAALAGFALAACLAALLAASGRVAISVQLAGPPKPVIQASAPPPPPTPVPPKAPVPTPPPSPKPAPPPAPPAPAKPPPSTRGYALALLGRAGAEPPSLKVIVQQDGRIRVEALHPTVLAPGKQLDLWVWPRGDAEPTLLGPIDQPRGGLSLPSPLAIEDGTPMMITVEPAGVPNTGQQGPTLFQGQLALVAG